MAQTALLRLLQISDSSFPSGAFAFSNGLETLHKENEKFDAGSLYKLLVQQIVPRWCDFDRYFIVSAYEANRDTAKLVDLDWKCHTQNTNAALADSSRRMGRSLLTVHRKINTTGVDEFWQKSSKLILNDERGYQPVVLGLVGRGLELSKQEVETSALYGTISSFFSAAIRLNIIGAIEAQRLISCVITELGEVLLKGPPTFPSSNALLSEIAVSRHRDSELSLFSN